MTPPTVIDWQPRLFAVPPSTVNNSSRQSSARIGSRFLVENTTWRYTFASDCDTGSPPRNDPFRVESPYPRRPRPSAWADRTGPSGRRHMNQSEDKWTRPTPATQLRNSHV